MEPLIAVAVASSVMTKFWEKNGEIIAEETFAASKNFTQKLMEKYPILLRLLKESLKNCLIMEELFWKLKRLLSGHAKLIIFSFPNPLSTFSIYAASLSRLS